MNVTAKVGWWGGALLLALCTRQIAFGVLPLALHWHRRQMGQLSQLLDRKLAQADDQLVAQRHHLQAQWDKFNQTIDQKLRQSDGLIVQVQHLQTQWDRTRQDILQRLAQCDQLGDQVRADVAQAVDQQRQQVSQLVDQIQQIQADLAQKLAADAASIRQHTAPIVQAVHQLQQRHLDIQLKTAPQVADLAAQLDRLQAQVDALVQGAVLRQGVGVFIDGANLHASARQLGVNLDYARILPHILPKNTLATAVHFYSGYDQDNLQHRQLRRDLEQIGMQMHIKPVTRFADGGTKANWDGQMIVDMLKSSFAHIVLLSGDGDFLPALETLADQGVQITVAAFAPNTHQRLRDKFPFRDLGKICTGRGRVIPLPVKQTSSSVG